jgi:hypothetical protein
LSFLKKITYHPFIIKLFNWEYWSFNVVYGPIYLYWFLLAIKSRSFFFFNAANPTIENGGFLLESKKEIYKLIPQEYYPKTAYLEKGASLIQALCSMKKNGLTYPLIAKPDIGARGRMVSVIKNNEELKTYIINIKEKFLLQELVEWEHEAGIFYYRYPEESSGHISGIVGKEFLTVTGDGISTMEELLSQNKRFILQIPALTKVYGEKLKTVLHKDEKEILVPYGNHARGSKFVDASHEIDDALTKMIDALSKKIPGFYFGRMDIKFNSWDELRQGKNFSIIELNGSGSEPTHIYDPKHSIFFAWKEIIRHWKLLQRISGLNHKLHNISYMSFKEGMQMLRNNKIHLKLTAENT